MKKDNYKMAKELKKICIVSGAIPPIFAGAGLRAYLYAGRLDKKGHLAFVLTRRGSRYNVKWNNSGWKQVVPEAKIIRVPAFYRMEKVAFFFKLKHFWIEYIKVPLCAMWKLARNRNRFDVIHCFGAGRALPLCAIAMGKVLRKKTILEITTVTEDNTLNFLQAKPTGIKERLLFWVFSMADIVVTISPALSFAYKSSKLDAGKLREIANPVDIERFCPPREDEKLELRNKLGIGLKQQALLFVGTIAERKGIDLLVEAFGKLANHYPDLLLFLVGPITKARERQEFVARMKQRLEELGISEKVIFTGLIDNVEEYMKASGVFVFASRTEGFGTVVVEAMATGLPVVAVNIPGITESIIEDGRDGIIIKEEDPEKVESAIIKLLQDKKLYQRISENAVRKVHAKFTNEVIDRKYEEIYLK